VLQATLFFLARQKKLRLAVLLVAEHFITAAVASPALPFFNHIKQK